MVVHTAGAHTVHMDHLDTVLPLGIPLGIIAPFQIGSEEASDRGELDIRTEPVEPFDPAQDPGVEDLCRSGEIIQCH